MAAVQQAGGGGAARQQTPPSQLNEGVSGMRSPPGNGVEGYFNPPARTSRANSIYSLSRASFTHQLSQLTSLSLPDSASLSSTVDAIPTAPAATTALRNAARQIQQWIQKAVEVLGGLDAEDDVEWAAAGGSDGLDDVDSAIVKFQRLVNAYVGAIENLQKRPDLNDVPKKDVRGALDTLDDVVASWAHVSKLLREVKRQVELALEWEELWNSVLGEIRLEIENLGKFIFEMEEKRHHAKVAESPTEINPHLDISELETIMEEGAPAERGAAGKGRASLKLPPQLMGASPLQSPDMERPELDHTGLMELFARMQPLKASLDFLPMRLASYRHRAEKVLPTACDELDTQRQHLEKKIAALQKDAEKVQEELGEDRWTATFRNVGKQALKMCETMERGIIKVQEAFDAASSANPNPANVLKKIADYKEKRAYYVPAIHKIVGLIGSGTKDRFTVNGEVLQILADTTSAWRRLEAHVKVVDAAVEQYQNHKSSQQMRDSMSSIVSHDFSTTESAVDTPGSSPASSVVIGHTPSNGSAKKKPAGAGLPSTPDTSKASRRSSLRSSSGSRPPPGQRRTPGAAAAQTPASSALSKRMSYVPSISRLQSQSPSPSSRVSSRQGSNTPMPATPIRSQVAAMPRTTGKPVPISERPKWNAGTRVDHKIYEAFHRPLELAKGNPNTRSLNGQVHRLGVASGRTSRTASASLAHPSPLWRESSASPGPGSRPGVTGVGGGRIPTARPASSMGMLQGRGAPSPAPIRTAPRSTPAKGGAAKGASARIAAGQGKVLAVKAHERQYIPTTPKASVPPRKPSGSHRLSLLPISSSYGLPGTGSPTASTFSTSNGVDDSPSGRPSLGSRPATALGMSSRRNSLLPQPVPKLAKS